MDSPTAALAMAAITLAAVNALRTWRFLVMFSEKLNAAIYDALVSLSRFENRSRRHAQPAVQQWPRPMGLEFVARWLVTALLLVAGVPTLLRAV